MTSRYLRKQHSNARTMPVFHLNHFYDNRRRFPTFRQRQQGPEPFVMQWMYTNSRSMVQGLMTTSSAYYILIYNSTRTRFHICVAPTNIYLIIDMSNVGNRFPKIVFRSKNLMNDPPESGQNTSNQQSSQIEKITDIAR